MFITNNHDSFNLYWKENLVKHQKVSKYYDLDFSGIIPSKEAERSKEGIDNCASVANTDLVHTGTRISNSNTYHYRKLTLPSVRHQQTTPALPKTEADGHLLLQETSTNQILETAHKTISAAWAPETKCKYKSIFKQW